MTYLRSPMSGACAPAPPRASMVDTACSLFERFHRYAPGELVRVPCQRVMPPVLVHLGWLKGLVYSSDRGQPGRPSSYVHFLDEPARLACDPEGGQLYVLGGRYRITRRGIEG